ncbi:hypothetical protein [Pyruvatibacter mobilis]|uniref:hypothetical protein n=1 Tax=Pyruvatibacter mobilis TaxID=1712261 RepID=UPI003C7B43C7
MKLLDVLRTAYVGSPPWIKRIAAPALGMVPAGLRFGASFKAIGESIERSENEADFVRQWQSERLAHQLDVARRMAPFYAGSLPNIERESFDKPYSVLCALPVLSKEQVREHGDAMLTRSKDKLDVVSTSGSGGRPLTFHLDKDRSVKEWAFVQHSWRRIGYQANDFRAVFRGIQIEGADQKPWEIEPALKELRCSPFHLMPQYMEQFCDQIATRSICFLHGYPSALTIFADYVQEVGREDVRQQIAGIICASEALYPHQRARLSSCFASAQITSFYGMSEKVAFACELNEAPGVFEFEPLYGMTELLDQDGNPISEVGATGRVVSTGLLFDGMPFIRYDTGDVAELVSAPKRDNCYRLRLKKLTSRWGQEYLVGADGRLISMTAINIHSSAYGYMNEFQLIQEVPGEAVVLVSLKEGRTEKDALQFVDEISQKVGSAVNFECKLCSRIPQNPRGKAKFIDQRLDLGALARLETP